MAYIDLMINTLLLDVDGVLQFRRPEFVAEMERDYRWRHGYLAFRRDVLEDPAEQQSLVGIGDVRALARRVLPRHVHGLSADVWVDRWLAEAFTSSHELIELLPHVAVDSIYLATNQEPVRGAYIEQLYAARGWLNGMLASHQIGHVKPEHAYFQTALTRIGRQPQECLFIDDKIDNILAGQAAGIPSIRFRGSAQLRADLAQHGLL